MNSIEGAYPLSPMQQGMLFHHLRDEGKGLYFQQSHYTLRARIDEVQFARSWEMAVARHAILRTAFTWASVSEPLQVVLRSAALPLEIQDWRRPSASDHGAGLEAYIAEDRLRGFDLG